MRLSTFACTVSYLILATFLVGAQAQAGVVTYTLDTEFSGATPPEGASPWLSATFDDSFGGPNTVRLTMSAGGLTDREFVAAWYFNLDPALNPSQLTFNRITSSTVTVNSIMTGTDAFQADGDGRFDIEFNFAPPPGTFNAKFTAGESVIYDISYVSTLLASSFDFGSAPAGGNGAFSTAAHVQGIGRNDNDSGWIGDAAAAPNPPPTQGVPEPMGLTLLGLGTLALGAVRRRQSIAR